MKLLAFLLLVKTVILGSLAPVEAQNLPVCIGIRGNGLRLWAHFTAVAQVVEKLGPIDGLAAASSGTISTWLFESMAINPRIEACGRNSCSVEEQRARLSFLLKTFQGLPQLALNPSPVLRRVLEDILVEVVAEGVPQRLVSSNTTIKAMAARELGDIFARNTAAVFSDLVSVTLRLSSLLNEEIIQLLINSPNPLYHIRDLRRGILGAPFVVDGDPLTVIRPGLLSFPGKAILLDILARFYSGYGATNLDDLEALLGDCAVRSVGLDFPEFSDLPTSNGMTCGSFFQRIFADFVLDDVDLSNATNPENFPNITTFLESFPNRLTDPVGSFIPTLIATSVLQGDSVAIYETALRDYENADVPVNFNVDWEDMSFGYFAGTQEIEREVKSRFADAKSQLFLPLGPTIWFDALIRSAAEPTLSRGVYIDDDSVSFAGWVDPVPAQVLSAMGCDLIIPVNQEGGIGAFTTDTARLFGASEEVVEDLYGLDDPSGAWLTALEEQDATVCADWDSFTPLEITGLSNEGYTAPFLSNDEAVLSLDIGASNQEIEGCTIITTISLDDFTLTMIAADVDRAALRSVLTDYLFERLSTDFSTLDNIILSPRETRGRELQETTTVSYFCSAVFLGQAPDSIEVIAKQREALDDTAAVQAAIDSDPNAGSGIIVESVSTAASETPDTFPDFDPFTSAAVLLKAPTTALVSVLFGWIVASNLLK